VSTAAATLEETKVEALAFTPAIVDAPRQRVNIGGVMVDNVDRAQAIARIDSFLRSGASHQVVTVNLDFLAVARDNPSFRDTLNSASLAVADGMPLVWLSHLKSDALPERVTGMTLVDECCRLAARAGRGLFLLGAAPGIADAAGENLRRRFPGLAILGTYSPPLGPMTPSENARIIRVINQSQAGVLLVALGAPRQDLWIRDNLHLLDVNVAMGVGCVFDVLAGVVQRAPAWMQRGGLEWAYRLAREPRRLWRRYIVNDAPVFGQLLLSSLRSERMNAPSQQESLVVLT
jgi:N-acetylglucosaminyldiphosphoundecaprenol N-acetyl-beta-D-mannosaminyltransferase